MKCSASVDVPNVLSSHMDPALVDDSKAIDFVLKAGDVSVHHPNIIHGSNPQYLGRAALWFDDSVHSNEHANYVRGTLALRIFTARRVRSWRERLRTTSQSTWTDSTCLSEGAKTG